jgi:hypothetical protein
MLRVVKEFGQQLDGCMEKGEQECQLLQLNLYQRFIDIILQILKMNYRYYQPNISENNIIELVQESLSESYEEPVEDDEAIVLSNLNDPEVLSDNTDKEDLNISILFN